MKILIKGAGDLATGAALVLHGQGHEILMTEIDMPLTVRTTVAMSRAVYEKKAVVEHITGILVKNLEEAIKVQANGDIAVIVDEYAGIRKSYQPDVLIDAIMAKRNVGTTIQDAPLVIALGPGFTAGADCHCVIETMRGDTLGQPIWAGSAIPDTKVPGVVAGFTAERLVRAASDGTMEPKASIGDIVEKGQLVAVTGGTPVYAQITGLIRGMLPCGVNVTQGMKIGDIDARCDRKLCRNISDKARRIGQGASCAVLQSKSEYAIVVLAAGSSRRFGSNKLFYEIDKVPMYRRLLCTLQEFPDVRKVLVSGYEKILEEARTEGVIPVENLSPEQGISRSVHLGIKACLKWNPDMKGILFTVCDQPGLSAKTIKSLLRKAIENPKKIICAAADGKPGNPVVWDRIYIEELLGIKGDAGGRQIMSLHKEDVIYVEADRIELSDVDTREDLDQMIKKPGWESGRKPGQ